MRNPIDVYRIVKSFFVLAKDPNRLDQVFALADSGANEKLIEEVVEFLQAYPACKEAMVTQPRLGKVDLAELHQLPVGTLGHAFADHMLRNGLDPTAIPVPPEPSAVWYLRTHMRETHDIWHVVTGMGTDVAGELALQAFYLAQIPSRLASALIAMGLIHVTWLHHEMRDVVMGAVVRGWLLGKRAKMLFGVEWAKLWTTPLADVRAQLGVEVDLQTAELPQLVPYVFSSAPSKATRASA